MVLSAGSAFDISITLEVAGIDTAVTVVADIQVLETARSQIAGTVPQAEVQNLPMNGRNFLDLALLVPGVSPTNTNSTQLFAETSAVPGQGLSIASQRNLSNSFIVDGVSANDDAAGLSGITFGVDAVEQFQVVTGGGQAELGRALGGYVNVVTKSGTNAPHGSLYGFFRNDAFNGENALTGQTLPMDQEQFGFSLGGPVRKDRTFYFTNVERKVLDQTGVVAITPENVAIINTKLNQVAYPGMPVTTGIYPNPVHSSNVLGKIDHQFSGADQLSVRYALYDVVSDNARGVGNLNAPSASSGLDNIDQSIAISNVWTISSNTVNETRVQISHGDLKAYSTDQIGPQVAISGVANFGTLSSSPWRRENTLFQAVSNVSHRAGAHALRAGVDFLFNDDTITFPRTFRGSYTFSSLGNFLTGNYSGFAQTFGDPAINQKNPNVGVYAQDEWRVGSRLTLNGGVRYDLQFLDTINTDTNNVSPRAGFVWAPTASETFLIRGGAGVFFDRVPLRAVANALLSAGNTTDPAQLHQPQVSGILPTQAGAPVFPNILPDRLPSTALVSFTTMDKDLQNAYSKQANIEVERTLGGSRTISVGYQYFRGENLLDVDQPERADVRGGRHEQRVSAGVDLHEQQSVSRRRRLELSRPAHHLPAASEELVRRSRQLRAVEVHERSRRSVFQLADRSDERDEGLGALRQRPAPPPRRQRLRQLADDAWHDDVGAHQPWVPGQHDGAVYSSLPFNIVSGVNSLQGTAGRPFADGSVSTPNFDVRQVEFIPRNAGTGSDFFTLSLRVSRSFRLAGGSRIEGLVEAFNLTDRVNPITRNTTFGPGSYPSNPVSSFNTVTAVGDPRTIQFGVRFIF